MADIGNYFGCSIDASLYLATPASAGGNGYGGSCRLGQMHLDGGIFPSINFGGQYGSFSNKLFPSADANMPGTSVPASSFTLYLGLTSLDRAIRTDADHRIKASTTDSESTISLGIGQMTVEPNNAWKIVTIRKDIGAGYSLRSSDTTLLRFSTGLRLESILNYNDESTAAAQSIPKNGRNISLWLGAELAYFNPSATLQVVNRHAGSFLALFNYIYSDAMSGATAILDYHSLNRDAAIVTDKVDEILGTSTTSPTATDATSEVQTLLGAASLFSGIGRGTQLNHFTQMNESSQNWLALYHGARTVILGIYAANSERPDALAPAVASSAHQAIDLIPIMQDWSRQKILAWRLGSSAAMMLLGAALAGGKYGKALSQVGMEGLVAAASKPNPLGNTIDGTSEDKDWISGTINEFLPWNSYHRSQSIGDINNSRPSYRHQTNLEKSGANIIYSIASPMMNASDGAARVETLLPGTSGTLKGPLSAAPTTPSVISVMLGHEMSSGNDNSTLRLHGGVSGGLQVEYSQSGLASGVMGEIGVRASINTTILDVPISFGPTARCSATKFMDGYSTDCSAGFSLSIE